MQDHFGALKSELKKFIIGQEELLERLCIALLVEGHVLLEGVPGLAKTRILSVLADSFRGDMQRVQFTPDLLPSDLVGTEVFRPQQGSFEVRKGPIFANIVLVDEINRAPAKVQSALLQAMAEREVTIGEETFKLPRPFFVLATQNPIEQEGTYPLPEAQLDRFLFKIIVEYPKPEEELEILKLSDDPNAFRDPEPSAVMTFDELAARREEMRKIFCSEALDRYIIALVSATRSPEQYGLGELIEWGASPRASLALRETARALAFIKGDEHVTAEHVKLVAHDVLRHRMLLSFEAEAKDTGIDEVISVLLRSVAIP